MRTYAFYSPSDKEFVMVVTESINDAIDILDEYNSLAMVDTNDYIIASGVDHREGKVSTFHCIE
jgi:hypothetical protein